MNLEENTNQIRLINGPVGPLLIRLTIPMIFGIFSMVLFNLVDTFYVGRLGIVELAALSFTFPVVLVVNSLALGLGIGASVVISRAIGEGNHHRVERMTTDSLILALGIVIPFVILGQLTVTPLFRLLGATEEVLPHIRSYMRIWYWGMIFVVIPMVGNNAIRAAGDTKTPSIIMMIAAGINFIIDPLLIFGIGPFPRLGIAGAAIATVFARAAAFCAAFYVLYHREKMITLTLAPFGIIWRTWKQVLFIGLPTAGTRIIIPVGVGVITRLVSEYGAESVAGYGVASRIEFFTIAVVMALSSVTGPFTGQNWGAKRIDRVQKGVIFSQRFALAWGFFMFIVLVFLGRFLSTVFNKDPNVTAVTALYLRMVPFGYGLYGVMVISASILNVLKKPIHAASLSILQMFILCVPLALLGSSLLGMKGIFGGVALSYLGGGITAYLVLKKIMNNEAKM